ncbi:O-antigen polymerase [Bacteroides reticulotermitis]|uniref:O-antigen polymerase n=1 Tax=Bacteroides reticulotermitis TaxID=1133319 RepID=UPI003A85C38E
MNDFTLVFINAVCYLILFYWYFHKVKVLNVGVMLLALWAISALGSILYEPVNFIGHNHKITLLPYIYLFIMNIIMFSPILLFRNEFINAIKINLWVYKYLCIFVSLICILPLCENVLYAFSHMSQSGIEQLQQLMNDRYEDSQLAFSYMSRPALICKRLLGFIGINVCSLLLVLFPIVFSIRKHRWLFIGVIMANANFMIEGFNVFARFIIAIHLIMLIFIFVLVYRYYIIELRRKIIRYSVLIIGVITFLFLIITLSRMNNREERTQTSITIYAYIGQYLSEGMGNFNANMWPVKKHTGIDRFKHAVLKKVSPQETERDRDQESFYLGYFSGAFYTAIGDYYRAYGGYVTALIVILSSLLFIQFFKRHRTISMSGIMLFVLYARMPLLGFLYNTYAVGTDEFLGSLLLIPIVYYFERSNKVRQIKALR